MKLLMSKFFLSTLVAGCLIVDNPLVGLFGLYTECALRALGY